MAGGWQGGAWQVGVIDDFEADATRNLAVGCDGR